MRHDTSPNLSRKNSLMLRSGLGVGSQRLKSCHCQLSVPVQLRRNIAYWQEHVPDQMVQVFN
jgi:hypothetical protein